jgi:hypothetical protein
MPKPERFCLQYLGFMVENQSILYPKGVITKW